MANTSEFIGPLDKLKRWMGGCYWMDSSSDSKNVLPLAYESKHATTSSTTSFSSVHSKNLVIKRKAKSREGTSVEEEIERSKVHWSQLTKHTNGNKEVAEVSNVEVFQSLQKHPTWGQFFRTFGDGGIYDFGKLVVGEKFVEGGQAKLYHAHVTWKNEEVNLFNKEHGYEFVLKVFRKGTFLKDLQKQWPQGIFQDFEKKLELQKLGKPQRTKYTCNIQCGTLLPNGRFAFLLVRETEDLRTLIDRKMKARTSFHFQPFPMEEAFIIMYCVARGMDRLHNLDIVHRDLKASNVLYAHLNKNSDKERYAFYVADFECSIGVVGTGFFRAPEILQAIKDKVVNKRPNLFTKASDVYSYGMVCYEILTGKLPFQGHLTYDFDHVLNGQWPKVPYHVDKWVHDLLQRCWQFDPAARPTFEEILKVLEANSRACKQIKQKQIEKIEMLAFIEQERVILKYEFES